MKTVLAIIGVVVVILACVVGGLVLIVGIAAIGDDEAQKIGSIDTPVPDTPTQPAKSFTIGDTIETSEWGDDWTLTVYSVEYPTGEGWQPKEGNKFVMLDLGVVNVSDEAQILSSMLAYALKDEENHEYSNWFTGAAPGEEPGGDFAPGETKRGPVVFQVPESSGGFVFVFEPSAFGSERVFITLE